MLTANVSMEVTAMRRLIIAFMAAVALAGCGSNGSTSAPPGQPGSINTGSPTAAPPPPDWTVPLMQTPYSPKVDPAQFSDKITNKYFPLVPGTVMVYEGKRDGVPLRIELTVTNETKDIFGVRTIVVRDIVTGALEERTSDWYAQDAAGNVWYFGEDTKEFTNGVVSSTAGSWEAGVDGALPGIIMQARPVQGEAYRQEYRPTVAEDVALIKRTRRLGRGPGGSLFRRAGDQRSRPAGPEQGRRQVLRPGRWARQARRARERPPRRRVAGLHPGAEVTDRTGPAMEARGLYHIYREAEVETIALRGAALTLEPGTWTSVMGPSGSGKSTLVYVLAGLVEPSGGAVVVDGEDLTRLPPPARARWRRQRVGVVLQRDNLHPLLDVAENIELPLRLEGRGRTQIRARVDQLLDEVGLADRRRHRAGQLSGGEGQRAAIAVALAPHPQVLLADEPTGELDESTAAGVLDLLATLKAREGASILTVTHNPQVAERADRRLVMRDGEILDGG